MAHILLMDDSPEVRLILGQELEREGYRVTVLDKADRSFETLAAGGIDLVVTDNRMPGITGIEFLKEMRQRGLLVPVILMTGHGTVETAVEAMKLGAFDYLIKPIDLTEILDELTAMVAEAIEAGRLIRERVSLPGESVIADSSTVLIGTSKPMQQVYKLIGQLAAGDSPVLVRGETGTGKEIIARAVFQHSRRCDKPFVAVNCAAIPEQLLESELFGYEKGAFTGADRKKIGKFEQANGGTILLDEIGDMSLPTQAKILRVLQEGEIQRLGTTEQFKIDVRVIACTHRDLETAIRDHTFREDLFYRLNGVTLRLPPLRERVGDLPLLAEHFLVRAAAAIGRTAPSLADAALQKLLQHNWPGNIREFQNVIRRAVLVCRGDRVTPGDLEFGSSSAPSNSPQAAADDAVELARKLACWALDGGHTNLYSMLHDILERELLRTALDRLSGNKAQVAKRLGMARNTVISRIQTYGLE